jgi:outer membrane protein assembly factor BamB
MGKNCRLCLAAAAGCVLLAACALLVTSPAEGQVKKVVQLPPPPPPPPNIIIGGPGVVIGGPGGVVPGSQGTGNQFSAIRLAEKSEYRQYIDVARDCIKDKAWNDACTALQTILDNKEDFYVRIKDRDPRTGREKERRTSVKYEANNILGSMPDDGLDVYEQRFGGKARRLLDEAKAGGEFDKVADVASRYLHTRAGTEASELMATYYLDRGQFFMAALRYERLLALGKRAPASDLTLFKAAFAYRRAGDVKNADRLWKELEPRLEKAGGLKIADQVVSAERLEQALAKIPRPEAINAHDWPLIRGNVTNSAQAAGSPPLLDEIVYRWPLAPDKNEISGEADEQKRQADTLLARLNPVLDRVRTQNGTPIMPGFFPVAVGDKVLFRTYFGISAYTLKEIKDADGKVVTKAGEFDWKSTDFDGALAVLLSENKDNIGGTVGNWLNMFQGQPGFSEMMYENSMVGTLATDHRYVYAVDDLAIPAHPNLMRMLQWQPQQVPAPVLRLVKGNTLRAYDVQTGSLKWEQGLSAKRDDFKEGLFLGPPLPVGGKLYGLFEKNNGELELVCLNPADGAVIGQPQQLGTVEQAAWITHDISRRVHAAHLAYGEGILVCPTHAGEVLGVDLLSRTLAWAYPYREKSPNQQPNIGGPFRPFPQPVMPIAGNITGNWYNTPPVIADGKVVFTAPDASSVHCINLRDGVMAWKRPQAEGDLFLGGVYNGKVVVVGKTGVRLLRLSTGEQVKFLPTGDVPSGQGVASRNVYYLPLKKGEICAIDLKRETVLAHNRAGTADAPAPGNLVFYEGVVLSQTPRELIVYPQLTRKLELADKAVLANPGDLTKLTERGELRLADGKVQGAVDDLREVLAKKPAANLVPRVRQKLYLAMTDLFQSNFNAASAKYLDEYRELCKVPENVEEEQQRQARFLRLVGEGRETQGNLVEAFQAYKDFGALPIHRGGVISLPEDPTHKVPTSVWLRGRVSNMIAHATAEQRRPLEEKIADEWKAVRARGDLDTIRSFVGMFDVAFQVGREARLQLAESILAKDDKGAFLEAELSLEQLRAGALREDPEVGGRALEALARLEMAKGTDESLQLAVAYTRRLASEFPKAKLRGGKTGAELFDELAADKRVLPYLNEGGPAWGGARIKARELDQQTTQKMQERYPFLHGFIIQPEGDLTPMTRQQRLLLEPNNITPQFSLVDVTGHKRRWQTSMGAGNSNMQFFNFLYNQANNNFGFLPRARFRHYLVKGHLAAVQGGTMAYGLDLESGKKLWQYSLLDQDLPPGSNIQQVMPDQDGHLYMMVWNQVFGGGQQRRIRVGHVAALGASYVAIQTQKSLIVLDPLHGTTMWSRADLPAETTVFGDDQNLYLVDVSGASASNGRALRASDGSEVAVPDFSALYQNRLRVHGHRILAAQPGREGVTLRLYDILAGKDVWSKAVGGKSTVLNSEDPNFTGAIDPAGKVTVLDARTGGLLMEGNAVQGRVTQDDVKGLHGPLLLADRDHFYVALNRPADAQRVAGIVNSNFSNGLDCAPVNGWFLAFHRKGGQRAEGGEVLKWKAGELHWHSCDPLHNQMVVLEQFDSLPVVIFTSRFMEQIKVNGGFAGQRWVSATQSVDRRTGKMVYDPLTPRGSNGNPHFYAFNVDLKDGTINMIGFTGTVQHYVDDGRKRAEQEGRLSPEPGGYSGPVGIGVPPPGVFVPRPIIRPRPIARPPIRRIQPAPLPPATK